MKLSDRDFRPPRRSKYVSQPPRKRPTVRILLLGIFAAAVYLKFDSFVSSAFFKSISSLLQTVSHPTFLKEKLFSSKHVDAQKLSPLKNNWVTPLEWSVDSNLVTLHCLGALTSECLSYADQFVSSNTVTSRILIQKIKLQWQLDSLKDISLQFRRILNTETQSNGWEILELVGLSNQGLTKIVLHDTAGQKNYCISSRCLDQLEPTSPLLKFQIVQHPFTRPEKLEFLPTHTNDFHSVLPGKIIEVDTLNRVVRLFHGQNLYSQYSGKIKLALNLKPGKLVSQKDTLGWIEDQNDSLATLALQVQKYGINQNPLAFLNIAPDTNLVYHGN